MKIVYLTATAVVGAALTLAAPASAQSGAACVLAGNATFSPGLSTTSQSFAFAFTGSLSNCHSTPAGPTGGSVSASGSGSGSCASSSAAGTATVTWNNGTTSAVSFTTTGAGAVVRVGEKVTSGQFAGESGNALLAFRPASGQNCATVPVTSAAFNGPTELAAG